MSYHLKFTLDGLPAMGLNARRHWRTVQKDNAAWLLRVQMATAGQRPAYPLTKAVLLLVRNSSVEPDFDNLVASFKPIVDALESVRIIENDKMSIIGQPVYQWHRAAPAKGSIEVEVWQREPASAGVEPPDEAA